MKNSTSKKSRVLLIIGLLCLATSQITAHLIEMPDLIKGITLGIGVGLILIALISGKFKTAQ